MKDQKKAEAVASARVQLLSPLPAKARNERYENDYDNRNDGWIPPRSARAPAARWNAQSAWSGTAQFLANQSMTE